MAGNFLNRSLLGQLLGMAPPEEELPPINQVPISKLNSERILAQQAGDQTRADAIMQMLLAREQQVAPKTSAMENIPTDPTTSTLQQLDPLKALKNPGYTQ